MTETTVTPLPTYLPPVPPRPHPVRVIAVGVGLAATLVAATFAALALGGVDGSGSPEAAVERLFAAVEHEDVLGVLEALPPGERAVLRDGLADVADELQRLGILADDLDLGSVSGLDLEVDGLELATEELAPGIAAVTVTGGTVTATTTPGELPLGPVVKEFLDDPSSAVEPDTTTEDLGDAEVALVTVERDGGWHVSLFYSIAEAARRDTGAPLPPFGAGVRPEGADSPEGALRALVDAASSLDVRRLVALTPPDEMAALHDYAPLFLEDAEAAIAEMTAEGEPFAVEVEHLATAVDGNGDVARVVVTELRASITAPWVGTVRYEWDGECARVEMDDEVEETCLSELRGDGYPFDLSGYELAVMTVRQGGSWYVSPTRSMFTAVVDVLRVIDAGALEDPEQLMWGLLGLGFGPTMGIGGPFGPFGFDGPSTYEDEGVVVSPDESEEWRTFDDELLDPGRDPSVHELDRCFLPLEELTDDATSEDVEKATAAVERCLRDNEGG